MMEEFWEIVITGSGPKHRAKKGVCALPPPRRLWDRGCHEKKSTLSKVWIISSQRIVMTILVLIIWYTLTTKKKCYLIWHSTGLNLELREIQTLYLYSQSKSYYQQVVACSHKCCATHKQAVWSHQPFLKYILQSAKGVFRNITTVGWTLWKEPIGNIYPCFFSLQWLFIYRCIMSFILF